MENKINDKTQDTSAGKKEIIKLALILFVITFAVALVLSVINAVTKDTIAERAADEQNSAMKFVMKEADSFKQVEQSFEKPVTSIYTAEKGSEKIGYCVLVSPLGFGGNIDIMVGFDNEDKITGVKIISMSETPGLGTRAMEEEFYTQYQDKTAPVNLVKNDKTSDSDIVAISGATVTSRAVTDGINKAYDAVTLLKGGAQ